MPLIPLGPSGTITGESCWHVCTLMNCPDNEQRREEIVQGITIKAALRSLKDDETVEITGADLKRLLGSPRLEDIIGDPGPGNLRGVVAAQILLTILTFKEHRLDLEVGVRKAKHLVEKRIVRHSLEVGRDFAASPAQVSDMWSQFKPVSHLWASFVLGQDPTTPQGLVPFLALAEDLRWRGQVVQIPRSRHPVLDEENMFKMPDGLYLPRAVYDIDPPTQNDLNDLEDYSALA